MNCFEVTITGTHGSVSILNIANVQTISLKVELGTPSNTLTPGRICGEIIYKDRQVDYFTLAKWNPRPREIPDFDKVFESYNSQMKDGVRLIELGPVIRSCMFWNRLARKEQKTDFFSEDEEGPYLKEEDSESEEIFFPLEEPVPEDEEGPCPKKRKTFQNNGKVTC